MKIMKLFTFMAATLALAVALAFAPMTASALEFTVGDSGSNPDGSTFVVLAGEPVESVDKVGGRDNDRDHNSDADD